MEPSARMIVELNIKHYRALLQSDIEPSKRATVTKLLAEEEAKLVRLVRKSGDDGADR